MKRESVRERLARRLETLIPGATFHPNDLHRHAARDISSGGSSWSGFGIDAKGIRRSVCSWDTMTRCAKAKSQVSFDEGRGFAFWEIHGG